MLSISGFDLPFMYKKMTNISNKIHFFSKKEFLYTAFYIYSVPILAILSGIFLFINKALLGRISLFVCTINGLIVSLYMSFYLTTSSILKIKNGGLGIYLLLICSLFGICYLISKRRSSNRKKILKQQSVNELAEM